MHIDSLTTSAVMLACILLLPACSKPEYVDATYAELAEEARRIAQTGGLLSKNTQAQKDLMKKEFEAKYLHKHVRWERGKIHSVEKSKRRRSYWCLVRMYSSVTFGLLDLPTVGCYVTEENAKDLSKGQAVTMDGRIVEIRNLGEQSTPFIALDPARIEVRHTSQLVGE